MLVSKKVASFTHNASIIGVQEAAHSTCRAVLGSEASLQRHPWAGNGQEIDELFRSQSETDHDTNSDQVLQNKS